MTLPGLSRPMRTGGFALLGVAAIAAAIGTASAVTGDDDPGTAQPTGEQPSPTTSGPGTGGNGGGTPTASPPGETTPGKEKTTSETKSTTPTTSPKKGTQRPAPTQGPGGQPDAPDGKDGDSVKSVPVRVYNNSNIRDLAARAADDLRARGWNVVATGNYSKGIIYTTTAYYRPGTTEKAAARQIGDEFGMRVAERFDGIKDASAGVIVIVTKDYAGADSGGKGGK